jgi:hypothetical protein
MGREHEQVILSELEILRKALEDIVSIGTSGTDVISGDVIRSTEAKIAHEALREGLTWRKNY